MFFQGVLVYFINYILKQFSVSNVCTRLNNLWSKSLGDSNLRQ